MIVQLVSYLCRVTIYKFATSLTIFIITLQDINSITVSPNDKLLATGSQDKTAKVFIIVISLAKQPILSRMEMLSLLH